MNFLDQAISETYNSSSIKGKVIPQIPITSRYEEPIIEALPIVEVAEIVEEVEPELDVFTVEEKSISSEYGIIKGKKGLYVNKNNINIVSDRYEMHQPKEIIETFREVAKNTGLQFSNKDVILNPRNGGLLLKAKYTDGVFLGEKHDLNLTFYTSHCGKYRTFLTLDALRLACFNQIPVLFKNKKRHLINPKHYAGSLNLDILSKKIEELPASIKAYEEKAEILNQNKMGFDTFLDMWASHNEVNREAKQFDTKVQNLRDTYYHADGQRGLEDTAYKAYQAVTYDNTHGGRKSDYKQENILTKQSDNSLEMLEVLLEECTY